MTLGMDRNNPWDLETRHIPWMGLLADQPKDGPLAFESLVDGIRAGVRLCYTYQERGWNTPRKFIEAFAPPSENPTGQYLANVCAWTGFDPDQQLNFHSSAVMLPWARAIWRQEQGNAAVGITDGQVYAGIGLAADDD